MTFDEYQKQSRSTAVYPNLGKNIDYPSLGLASEAGEVCGVIKKVARDLKGVVDDNSRTKLRKEIGGVLWYCAALSSELGLSLEEIALENLGVLAERKEAGMIGGGDIDDLTIPIRQTVNGHLLEGMMLVLPPTSVLPLSFGQPYGTDPDYIVGTARITWSNGGYVMSDIRIRPDAPDNIRGDLQKVGLLQALLLGEWGGTSAVSTRLADSRQDSPMPMVTAARTHFTANTICLVPYPA